MSERMDVEVILALVVCPILIAADLALVAVAVAS